MVMVVGANHDHWTSRPEMSNKDIIQVLSGFENTDVHALLTHSNLN